MAQPSDGGATYEYSALYGNKARSRTPFKPIRKEYSAMPWYKYIYSGENKYLIHCRFCRFSNLQRM
jgi:hypothetical protein